MTRTIFIAAALALVVAAEPASAQVNRTYVSAAGSDTNNCANVAMPCRHFQNAVNATAVGGEVVALDPANYGSFTINQAITIEGQGWAYVAPPNDGNGIAINAVSGNVIIRGVLLNGDGATGGTNGIVFNSGASLTVTDCVVQNFSSNGPPTTGNGILLQPSTGTITFVITNTIVSNNGYVGFDYAPTSGSATANGVIDHFVATDSQYGIAVGTSSGGGATTVAISNGVVGNNSNAGINIQNGSNALTISIDNTNITGNLNGIAAYNTSNVFLGRSVITANGTGTFNPTTPNTFYSYSDNHIGGNGSDINGALNYSYGLR